MKKPNYKRTLDIGRIPDPEDSYAQVELYRWQHGELPFDDSKDLDVSKGLIGMADAIDKRDLDNFPAPFNVSSVLRYAAKKLKECDVK